MSEQLKLWDRPSLNPIPRVKEAIRQALQRCQQRGLTRDNVAVRMNEHLRAEGLRTNGKAGIITIEQIEKWVSGSDDHAIHWKLLPIFCFVTEDIGPLQALVAPLGAEVVAREEVPLLKWARLEVESRKLRRRKRRLEEDIKL